MVRGGFERILEVPICLGDSSNGTSRLTWREQWRFLRQLRGLYRHRYPVRTEFVQFGLVGVSGFVVDVSAYLGLQFLFGLQHHLARGLSFWVSASWNWAWNRAVTFSDRRRTRKRLQWPAFILSSLLGFLMNWGTYYALTSTLPFFDGGVTRILAMFLGVVAGMGLNFVLARTFVFARVA